MASSQGLGAQSGPPFLSPLKGSSAWSRARQPLWKQPEPCSAVVDPRTGPAVGTQLGPPR